MRLKDDVPNNKMLTYWTVPYRAVELQEAEPKNFRRYKRPRSVIFDASYELEGTQAWRRGLRSCTCDSIATLRSFGARTTQNTRVLHWQIPPFY